MRSGQAQIPAGSGKEEGRQGRGGGAENLKTTEEAKNKGGVRVVRGDE